MTDNKPMMLYTATLGGRTASIIRLVPGISAIALLTFGPHI